MHAGPTCMRPYTRVASLATQEEQRDQPHECGCQSVSWHCLQSIRQLDHDQYQVNANHDATSFEKVVAGPGNCCLMPARSQAKSARRRFLLTGWCAGMGWACQAGSSPCSLPPPGRVPPALAIAFRTCGFWVEEARYASEVALHGCRLQNYRATFTTICSKRIFERMLASMLYRCTEAHQEKK